MPIDVDFAPNAGSSAEPIVPAEPIVRSETLPSNF